jgi:hypothetical protein
MEETSDKKKNDSSDESSPSSSTKRKSKVPSYECKICGAPAYHSNYGAVTCYPCKMFFKRNVTITQVGFISTIEEKKRYFI